MRRRLSDAERHARHHELIAERKAAFERLPKGSAGLARYRRREADKQATWTLRGHLLSEHGQRGWIPALCSYAELEALHARLHGS